MKIIKKATCKTTRWHGGATTELLLSPTGGDLKALQFDYRLSLATADGVAGCFTPLPGVDRCFTVIDGKALLQHDNAAIKHIGLLEQNYFSGKSEVQSQGAFKAFNLMTMNGLKGRVDVKRIEAGEQVAFGNAEVMACFAYVVSGNATLKGMEQTLVVEGDLIVEFGNKLLLEGRADTVLLWISIE